MKEETWHKKVDTAFQKPGYLKKKWEQVKDSRQCLVEMLPLYLQTQLISMCETAERSFL